MVAARIFLTVHYLRPLLHLYPVSTLRRINQRLTPATKIVMLWLLTVLVVYLLMSNLSLQEIRTFPIWYAGELWIAFWRAMAQSFQVAIHYYSSLFTHFSLLIQPIFSVLGG